MSDVFRGPGVALLTLFHDDGSIDPGATADLARELVERGMRAVMDEAAREGVGVLWHGLGPDSMAVTAEGPNGDRIFGEQPPGFVRIVSIVFGALAELIDG